MIVEIELDIVSAAVLEQISESKKEETIIVDFLTKEVKQTKGKSFARKVKQTTSKGEQK